MVICLHCSFIRGLFLKKKIEFRIELNFNKPSCVIVSCLGLSGLGVRGRGEGKAAVKVRFGC